MLHTHLPSKNHRRSRVIHESVTSQVDQRKVFSLLLNVSQFEFVLKDMFQSLLDVKQTKWDKHRDEGSDRMKELSEVFGGNTPLSRVEKNDNLRDYFESIAGQVSTVSLCFPLPLSFVLSVSRE